MLTPYGTCGNTGRQLFSLAVPDLDQLPGHFKLGSQHFVLMIVTDARQLPTQALLDLAKWALNKGAVYICAWGPDCERVHDLTDQVVVESNPNPSDETVIMTTWHEKESLDEALWFTLNSAFPAAAYESTCRSVVVLTIGNDDWKSQVARRLSEPTALEDLLPTEGENGKS